MDKLLYIGHFSSAGADINKAASAAGDLVQNQIITESIAVLGKSNVFFYSMEPNPCWPRGTLIVKSKRNDRGFFPGYINLPYLKNIIFSLSVVNGFIKFKPKLVMQYNSYLFENLTLLSFKLFFKAKIISIVQDVRIGDSFSNIATLNDQCSNYFLKYFTHVIPVTLALAEHLKLQPSKVTIFQGGVADFGLECCATKFYTENFAVFAGAIENYNGIDKLLDEWINQRIGIDLHIFGKGSQIDRLKENFRKNKRIVFHGFSTQEEVMKWQIKAKFNVCLRYSEGLNSEFFFPSKFFNVAMCPGLVILNDFSGLPSFFKTTPSLCQNDLKNLKEIELIDDNTILLNSKKRREYILKHHSWKDLLKKVFFQIL